MTSKTLLLLLLLIILVLPSNADSSYPHPGYREDSYLINGTMYGFTNTNTDIVAYVKGVVRDNSSSPLVVDLDGDGTKEIIIVDGNSINMYEEITLDVVDSADIQSKAQGGNKFITTFDIDGDSLNEILIQSRESRYLEIYKFNGTNIFNVTTIDTQIGGGSDGGQKIIKCRGVDDCAVVGAVNDRRVAATNNFVRFTVFNSTSYVNHQDMHGGVALALCLPAVSQMIVDDYDGDGEAEYIYTFVENDGSANEDYVQFVDVDDTTHASTLEMTVNPGEVWSFAMGIGESCGETSRLISSPIIDNFDGSPSNGFEVVYAVANDADEFRIVEVRSNGDTETFSELGNAEGSLISNVFKGNFFEGTGDLDFCAFGFNEGEQMLNLLCGSDLLNDVELYQYDMSGLYNVTVGDYSNTMTVHSVQAAALPLFSGNNRNEILTPYGIFWFLTTDELFLLWENPKQSGVSIPVDYQDVGMNDIISVTQGNVWYIDDGFTNSPASIEYFNSNPCVEQTWKVNTSVQIRMIVSDPDGDLVSARAILYANTSYAQDSGWAANTSSESTVYSFNFIANVTTPTGTIRVLVKDTGDGGIVSYDQPFSVGLTGVVFGDCQTDIIFEDEPVVNGTPLNPQTNNSVENFVDFVEGGTGIGRLGIWIILMFVLACMIFLADTGIHSVDSHKLGFILVAEMFMLVLGTIFGFVSVAVVIVLVILSLIPAAFYVRKLFVGD